MRTKIIPLPVNKVLTKLGGDIKDARIRRRISIDIMCQRAGISKPTLIKIEKGDPNTSIGVYTKVLFVLGLERHLADVADIRYDSVGMAIDSESLPKRVVL